MGKLIAFITGSLSLVLALLGGYLLDLQRDESLQPFNEYMDFDSFVRDIADIQYFLNAAAIFNQYILVDYALYELLHIFMTLELF